MDKITIKDLLIKYFKKHPKEDLPHGPVVDWVEEEYKKIYNKKPRDTWRSIRNLHETGFLIKVRKGIYRYDPKAVKLKELVDFNNEQKDAILKETALNVLFAEKEKQKVLNCMLTT